MASAQSSNEEKMELKRLTEEDNKYVIDYHTTGEDDKSTKDEYELYEESIIERPIEYLTASESFLNYGEVRNVISESDRPWIIDFFHEKTSILREISQILELLENVRLNRSMINIFHLWKMCMWFASNTKLDALRRKVISVDYKFEDWMNDISLPVNDIKDGDEKLLSQFEEMKTESIDKIKKVAATAGFILFVTERAEFAEKFDYKRLMDLWKGNSSVEKMEEDDKSGEKDIPLKECRSELYKSF
jgi:hypothetical protein